MHTTTCPRPFEWCEIHPDGSVFLCCPAWLKRPVGNLLKMTAEEAWNSPTAIEIRKSVLNGSYHNCNTSRCPRLSGLGSAVDSGWPLARQAISAGTSRLDHLPTRLNLSFDTGCNLACPSCRNALRAPQAAEPEQAQRLTKQVRAQLLPSARELTLSGYGDPFASPVYFEFLRLIDPDRLPQLKAIRLHTNGLLLDATHWRKLAHLQHLVRAIEVSVDAGTAATYRANRGAEFEDLLQNLDFIAGLKIPLRLSMVVQQNNFQEIEELYALARRLGATLYLSRLVNWGTFSREEFQRRNVAEPRHPQHAELLEQLHKLDGSPGLDIGNLAQLRTS